MFYRLLFVLSFLLQLSSACAHSGVVDPEWDAPPALLTPAERHISTPSVVSPNLASDLHCPHEWLPFVASFEVLQTPDLPEPSPRIPFQDPVFGTCIIRVTDRSADAGPHRKVPGLKNEYARVQSFNADSSLILVRGVDATWHLYDANTLQPLGPLPLEGSVDPRWDANDPFRLYFSDKTRLMSLDLEAEEIVRVHEFADDLPGHILAAVWTRYEGSPSADGRYWGLMAHDEDWDPVALLVYDHWADRVIAVRELSGAPEMDSVTVSPLGNFFLAYFEACTSGLGNEIHPCGLMVYDQKLQNGRGMLRVVGHSDTALDAQGREVLVYQDIDRDHIAMLDLASGESTPLWPIDFSHSALGLHFSGRAFERPGWALISTYNGGYPSDKTWMDDQVFALELVPGGRVVRLAHTHSRVAERLEHDYWAEPQASANIDLTRVVFTSNWGRSGSDQVEMYLIVLPADWPSRLP